MNRVAAVRLVLFVVSYVAAIVALLAGAHEIGRIVIWPALILSAWGFMGHAVTLSDDMPGEWSNPDESRRQWLYSCLALAAKCLLLVVALLLFGALAVA